MGWREGRERLWCWDRVFKAGIEILLATGTMAAVVGVAATARPKGHRSRIPALVHIGGGRLVARPGRRSAVSSTVGGRAEATVAMKQAGRRDATGGKSGGSGEDEGEGRLGL